MKMTVQKVVRCEECTVDDVRELIKTAGTQIGSVHFIKRTDGSLRKMCYRLNVKNPSHSKAPSGKNDRRAINDKHDIMTVYDVNHVKRDKNGNVLRDCCARILRGDWRSIPLDNVKRIRTGGVVYEIL